MSLTSKFRFHLRSLHAQLLLPLLIVTALTSCVIVKLTRTRYVADFELKALERAKMLAHSVNYVAESVANYEELQRIVHLFGAESEVDLIVLVAGSPLKIIATTNNVLTGKWIDVLPEQEMKDSLSKVLFSEGRVDEHSILTHNKCIISIPLYTAAENARTRLYRGAILVKLDLSHSRAALESRLHEVALLTVGVCASLMLVSFFFLHRKILAPLQLLLLYIKKRRNVKDTVHPPQFQTPEFAYLSHVLEDTFKALAQRSIELEAAKEEALLASQAKSDFLSNVSHEIRTPLNGVLGITEVLSKTSLDTQQRRYLEMIQLSGNALLSVINDVLDLSKIEAGKLELHFEWFTLENLISRACTPSEIQRAEKNLSLQVILPDKIPARLYGSFVALGQVLINLLGNAVKFTPNGGTITLSFSIIEQGKGKVLLSISVIDTGIGITESKLKEVFSPFSQADRQISKNYGGTGLGLTICDRLVRLMEGEIWLESEVNKGSSFHFFVPLLAADHVGDEKDSSTINKSDHSVPNLPQSMIKVLIVEDNFINQSVLTEMLPSSHFKTILVNQGEEALAELDLDRFTIVLMDCQMPGIDGLETVKIIREREKKLGRHTPIIALTAYASEDQRQQCLQAGMDDFLAKPFTQEALLNKVAKVLSSSREIIQ